MTEYDRVVMEAMRGDWGPAAYTTFHEVEVSTDPADDPDADPPDTNFHTITFTSTLANDDATALAIAKALDRVHETYGSE